MQYVFSRRRWCGVALPRPHRQTPVAGRLDAASRETRLIIKKVCVKYARPKLGSYRLGSLEWANHYVSCFMSNVWRKGNYSTVVEWFVRGVFFCFIHHLAFSFSGWEKRPNERPAAVVKIIKTTVTLDAYFIKRKLKQSVPRSAGGAHAAY